MRIQNIQILQEQPKITFKGCSMPTNLYPTGKNRLCDLPYGKNRLIPQGSKLDLLA